VTGIRFHPERHVDSYDHFHRQFTRILRPYSTSNK
jgi:hypothetical protein